MAAKEIPKPSEATEDSQILALFPLYKKREWAMGPHVASETKFLKLVKHTREKENCHYFYILDGETKTKPVTALSYRIIHNLSHGKVMCIDVINPDDRERYAETIVDYVLEEAKNTHCNAITLDCTHTNFDTRNNLENELKFAQHQYYFTLTIDKNSTDLSAVLL